MTDHDSRRVILARRAKFVAAALAGAGIVASAQACGGETARDGTDAAGDAAPQPCLKTHADAEPQPCLGAPLEDAQPQPCLEAPIEDAQPQPCLDVPGDAAVE